MKKFVLILILVVTGLFIVLNSETAVTKNIHSYVYDLPFAPGTSHKVVQGYGGVFSHKHKAALDFSMEQGTPVYAAREGIIYSTKDDSEAGGPLPKYQGQANYIIIKHPDGSFGCYWHLRHKGVALKKGKVKRGQLIGYSGSTGFVLRPHLHFAVKQKLNYDKDSFVRTKFRTANGIQFFDRGKSYENPLK